MLVTHTQKIIIIIIVLDFLRAFQRLRLKILISDDLDFSTRIPIWSYKLKTPEEIKSLTKCD